jgi:hypothetical protein
MPNTTPFKKILKPWEYVAPLSKLISTNEIFQNIKINVGNQLYFELWVIIEDCSWIEKISMEQKMKPNKPHNVTKVITEKKNHLQY